MPAQDQSNKIGTSPSPVAESAIRTGVNSQNCTTDVNKALAGKFNEHPVSIPK